MHNQLWSWFKIWRRRDKGEPATWCQIFSKEDQSVTKPAWIGYASFVINAVWAAGTSPKQNETNINISGSVTLLRKSANLRQQIFVFQGFEPNEHRIRILREFQVCNQSPKFMFASCSLVLWRNASRRNAKQCSHSEVKAPPNVIFESHCKTGFIESKQH